MRGTIVVGLVLALGALAGCDESKPAEAMKPADPPKAAAPAPTPAPAPAAAAPAAAAAGGDIGVKECDDYIAKFNSCYKDPAVKAAAQPGLDAMKKSWTGMAANPATKPALANACKMALDNFPSAACK